MTWLYGFKLLTFPKREQFKNITEETPINRHIYDIEFYLAVYPENDTVYQKKVLNKNHY